MARVIPPIFLLVTAFLINMTLSRLIDLEREQIGLLKALGYAQRAIASHYLKLVLAISVVGILIGIGLANVVRARPDAALRRVLPLPVLDLPARRRRVFRRGGDLGRPRWLVD